MHDRKEKKEPQRDQRTAGRVRKEAERGESNWGFFTQGPKPISTTAYCPDPPTSSSSAGGGGPPQQPQSPSPSSVTSTSKRRASKVPPWKVVSPSETIFRLLCPADKTGAVIGKGGSVVRLLRDETGARIRVEDPFPSSDERVILIAAPPGVDVEESGLPSPAQRALLRVFERIFARGEEVKEEGQVACRLLAASSQVGGVLGRGGRIVERIRRDSGAQIRVFSNDQLPHWAAFGDELIQITGSFDAIRKALLSVSGCLQENPQIDGGEREEEVVFRILCSNEKVGGIIGKGGVIIRTIQNETGATIKIVDAVPECEERVIAISAYESLDSKQSPTQDAVLRVHSRLTEAGTEKGSAALARLLVPSQQIGCLLGRGGNIIAEMRRATGANIRIFLKEQTPKCAQPKDEVVQVTGSFQRVQEALLHITSRIRETILPLKLNPATVPYSLAANENPAAFYRSRNEPESPLGCPPAMFPHGLDWSGSFPRNREWQPPLFHSSDHFGLSSAERGSLSYPNEPKGHHSAYEHSNSRTWAPKAMHSINMRSIPEPGPGTSFRGGPSGTTGSVRQTSGATNTTSEVVVPQQYLRFVCGEDSDDLAQIRELSGANVTIHDPESGAAEGLVIISGSVDQIHTAQMLLHAFILCGKTAAAS